MKVCTRCKNTKSIDQFAKRSKNKDGLSGWCKACFAANSREKYQADPLERARKFRNQASWLQTNRDNLVKYLADHPCVDCGNSDIRVLEFDHRNPAEKTFNISSKIRAYTWRLIEEEISKCDVRCSNCHRIRTGVQFKWWTSE